MEVSGIVHLVLEKKQVTDNMSKQEVIIKTTEQYPQAIKIEFVNAKTELLNGVNVGDNVTISINLRGNLSKDGVNAYVSIQGWKITKNN
jgi:hypothetical protein